ncbi:MAG TPA: protein kinase [bacterium]
MNLIMMISEIPTDKKILSLIDRILDYKIDGFSVSYIIWIAGGIIVLYLLISFMKWLVAPPKIKVFAPGGIVDSRAALKFAREAVKTGNFRQAAELYHQVGNLLRAAELYEEGRLYSKAADIYIELGKFEKAVNLLEKSGKLPELANIYVKRENFAKAGELFERIGNYILAAEMYEKIGNGLKAAYLYEKSGDYARAAEMFSNLRKFENAAEMYEKSYYEEFSSAKADDTRTRSEPVKKFAYKSGENYYKAGRLDKSINILVSGGFYQKAAEISVESKKFEQAADLFLKSNLPLKAAEAYEALGDSKKASQLKADAYRLSGDKTNAAEEYEKGGNYLDAAEIYRGIDNFQKAGQMYMLGNDFLQAAEMFLKAKEPKSAALAYERGRDYVKAAEIYQRLGEFQKQCDMLEKLGNYYAAGDNYYQHNEVDKAIALLQKVEKTSREYRKAAVLLGDIFKDKNMLTQAIHKYKDAIAGEGVNKFTLHPYYHLAKVLEDHGNSTAALEIYERILTEDYNFSDVAARVAGLVEKFRKKEDVKDKKAIRSEKRFELLEEIGRGGMGIVYKARDLLLNRVVAYKLLPSSLKDDQDAVQNFLREARAAAALNHPNIVSIYDVIEDGGEYSIVMEFVEGFTLKKRIQEVTKIPVKATIQIVIQLCKALDYAHQNNIIHRDIKSNNIMLSKDNIIKILDFGLAKILHDIINLQTRSMGTPFYASPEQILGDPKVMPIDHRTDIYSLGITIFEMVTGVLPFTKGDIGYHHIHTPPPVPSSLVQGIIPVEIDHIVLKCLEKDLVKRYARASEIIDELKSII